MYKINENEPKIKVDGDKLSLNGNFRIIRVYHESLENRKQFKYLDWIILSFKGQIFTMSMVELKYIKAFFRLFLQKKLPLKYSNKFFTTVEKNKIQYIQFDFFIKNDIKIDENLKQKYPEFKSVYLDIVDVQAMSEILSEATYGFSLLFLNSPKYIDDITSDLITSINISEQISHHLDYKIFK